MRPSYLCASLGYHGHSFFAEWKNEFFPHRDVLHEPTNQINETPDTANPFLERGSDSQRPWYANDDDLNDPQYEHFFSHLEEDGNSYKLKIPNHYNDDMLLVNYEEDDIFSEISQDDTMNVFSMNCADPSNKREASIPASDRKSSPVPPFIAESQHRKRSTDVEDSYGKFIEKLRFENNFMVLEWEPGMIITYEADDPLKSSERTITEKGVEGDSTDFVPHGFPTSIPYRRRLMQVLKKPYDRNEYEELLNKVSEQKPIKKEKHLRHESILYDSNQIGQSYLDRYPEFARLLRAAGRVEGLKLLRGFFFWLQNLCHEGAFIPWRTFSLSKTARLEVTDCEIIPSTDENLMVVEE